MPDKTVIIAGAGFSAPARIPIQNQIMNDMIAQAPSIMESTADELDLDTKSFLDAFVRVGLYLLDNYCSTGDEVLPLLPCHTVYALFPTFYEIKSKFIFFCGILGAVGRPHFHYIKRSFYFISLAKAGFTTGTASGFLTRKP